MPLKYFIATHTFISDETKKEYFKNCKGLSSKEWFSYAKNEYAKCIQHWMGTSDFFFCHWIAVDEARMGLIPKDYFRYDPRCIKKFNFSPLFKLFINSGNNLAYSFRVMISSKGFFSKLSLI